MKFKTLFSIASTLNKLLFCSVLDVAREPQTENYCFISLSSILLPLIAFALLTFNVV
jgi:hypothetical protein